MDILSSFILIISYFLFSCSTISHGADTIAPSQSLLDGNTLISKNGTFELGFFTPGNSSNRYLGMWYKNVPVKTIVWVANSLKPIKNMSGFVTLNTNGSIFLVSDNATVIWSANPSRTSPNLILQLLDSGNLVLREENDNNPDNYLWQSFDYPSDTLLPGMKLGKNLRTGFNRRVIAWKNQDDPSPGNLTWGMHVDNYPEPVMWIGSKKHFRSGPWNGLQYSGKPTNKRVPFFDYEYYSDTNEVYYMYKLVNKSAIARIVLNQTLEARQHFVWMEAERNWKVAITMPRDFCDNYGVCGPNGNCDINSSPACGCLKGFKPKSLDNWNVADYTRGCERNVPLDCETDGFVKLLGLKMPDTTNSWLNQSMNLQECKEMCLRNCSCTAYTNSDIRGEGSGCATWFGDLIDVRVQPDGGQDLHVRMPASELERNSGSKKKIASILGGVFAVISGMLLALCCRCRSRIRSKSKTEKEKEDLGLPLFELSRIVSATGNFSINNKLGEGGFGPVYKGKLDDGQEIAVKRLSRSSGQGLNEFKNEVILIAKLQHRNLVKLLGCCIQGEENLLIYEYMPNKSLDFFIFDQTQARLLDWSKRFNIICGIARGLLYLHQDSRLRIVHRDLKASNVLLDSDMNPKISDFGMARIFGGDQTAGNTNRVVGTYGYMAPEYAINGHFSAKSDVFSFGILLLEIVTGKKNRGFYNNTLTLTGHAWQLWREGRPFELVDECLRDSCSVSEVVRCVHISLLCLQHRPHDRPNMSSVVVMLGSETALPHPKQPGFFVGHLHSLDGDSSSGKNESPSVYDMSITVLDPR